MNVAVQSLFYSADIAQVALQLYVFGAFEPPAIDIIEFPEESGGEQLRELALPYLPGMDEVVLTAAQLDFRVGDLTTELSHYTVGRRPAGNGVILTLPAAARLRQVELQVALPQPPSPQLRIVVRPMQGNEAGPPILVWPELQSIGAMFGVPLAGLTVTELGGSRHLLNLPDVAGTAWLFQLASGDTATDLSPAKVEPTINRVAVAAAPRNLAITLQSVPPTLLWSNPDALLPGSGVQTVSFLPIAQRQLSDSLPKVAQGTLTLPLRLKFATETGARLEITERSLTGEYRVRPLGETPYKLRLAARPEPVLLDAPAARRPIRAEATITASLLGRVLNGGSPAAPYGLIGRGLRATLDRAIAASVPIVARPGDPADAQVPLASIALRLDTPEAAEIVLELRADAAGQPGAVMAPTVVRQTKAGDAGWVEFELAAPLHVPAGAPVWAAIRMTKGTALWHTADRVADNSIGSSMVSIDRGTSWGVASGPLETPRPLLAQAFHVEDPPYRRPEIFLHDGVAPIPGDLFAGAVAEGKSQFRLANATLPAALLNRLAGARANGTAPRIESEVLLYSGTVIDLVLSGMVLSYEPVPM